MGFHFPKKRRVLRRADFLAIQSQGRKTHADHFVVLMRPRADAEPARLGLVTSRKVANAVGRNRVRRLLREVFRNNLGAFPRGADVVIIARTGAAELALSAVRGEILAALTRRRSVGATPRGGVQNP